MGAVICGVAIKEVDAIDVLTGAAGGPTAGAVCVDGPDNGVEIARDGCGDSNHRGTDCDSEKCRFAVTAGVRVTGADEI